MQGLRALAAFSARKDLSKTHGGRYPLSTMSAIKFNTVFERDEAGFIYAHVPELPEVQTQGRTLDEAREMVRSAIGQALDLRRERGEPVPGEGWAATELVEAG